jgi:hypothetical protein
MADPSPQVIPAPVGGINAADPIITMGADDAIYSYNLVPDLYGLRIRKGYKEWCTNVAGNSTDHTVKTVMPFTGSADAGTNDRLFACTDEGIYRVDASSSTPTKALTFGTHNSDAGRGEWQNFVSAADRYLLYCDEANGYYTYPQSTATWAKIAAGAGAGQINGVDPANFVMVTVWKERILFVEKSTSKMWYLPTGQVTGTVTAFEFGNKFPHGGTLAGLYTWTVDGGVGVDDFLVAVSRTGDVLLYQGTDPSDATKFEVKGHWFVGNLPKGRRVAAKFGGDLMVLSVFGVIPLSKLLAGEDIMAEIYATRKVSPVISTLMAELKDYHGWEMRSIPNSNLTLIGVPKQGTQVRDLQAVQSVQTRGWTFYRDLPYYTGEVYKGEFYFGTTTGKVMKHTGNVDAQLLDGTGAQPVEFSVLTSFLTLGSPGRLKQVPLLKPIFITKETPAYEIAAKFDYDVNEFTRAVVYTASNYGIWDVGLWNQALWGGGYNTTVPIAGGAGMGDSVAVACRGKVASETTLAGFKYLITQGGVIW